jgi:hemerythrin
MAFFQWKTGFDIGVAEIDRQHREFLECLNEVYDEAAAAGKAGIGKASVERLKRSARKHFEYEERLIQVARYAESEFQAQQHYVFNSRLLELEDERVSSDIEKLNVLLAMLRDWFLNHILQEDTKFVPFVAALESRG